MILATPPEGFVACAHAIAAMDQRESIRAIDRPTLVVVGEARPRHSAVRGGGHS